MSNPGTPHRHPRNPAIVARETEIIRLVTLWRSRGVEYADISERLAEKGFTVPAARARKIMQGQSV